MKTLVQTASIIKNATDFERQRIADAYAEAQALAAGIEIDGDARPRIVACFERCNVFRAANDAAAAGWMLTALQERLAEKDLVGWEALQIIADQCAALLQPPAPRLH